MSSLLLPSPSNIFSKWSIRSSSNAHNWGASTTLFGADMCTTNSPICLTTEFPACPIVCVSLCRGLVPFASESCASSSIIELLIPFSKYPLCWTFATAMSSWLFPSPSYIVIKGSIWSFSNACSWCINQPSWTLFASNKQPYLSSHWVHSAPCSLCGPLSRFCANYGENFCLLI